MSEDDLHNTTMRAFQNKLLGRRKYEEVRYKENWEQHRELVVTIMSPNLDKKYRKKSAKDLYKLPWDVDQSKANKVDADRLKKAFDHLDQRLKK